MKSESKAMGIESVRSKFPRVADIIDRAHAAFPENPDRTVFLSWIATIPSSDFSSGDLAFLLERRAAHFSPAGALGAGVPSLLSFPVVLKVAGGMVRAESLLPLSPSIEIFELQCGNRGIFFSFHLPNGQNYAFGNLDVEVIRAEGAPATTPHNDAEAVRLTMNFLKALSGPGKRPISRTLRAGMFALAIGLK